MTLGLALCSWSSGAGRALVGPGCTHQRIPPPLQPSLVSPTALSTRAEAAGFAASLQNLGPREYNAKRR